MQFEIVSVVVNSKHKGCFDISIRNNETQEVRVIDCVKIWEDGDALFDLFYDSELTEVSRF